MDAHSTYRTRYSMPTPEAIEGFYTGMRQFWQPVLASAELPENGLRGVELLEEPVLLARLNGELVAMQDLCRHFQAALSTGQIRQIGGKDCISCGYHGWAYDTTGKCVEIPQLADGREIPTEARVPTYHVQEKYGLIWVCMADEPMYDLPEFPEIDDPDFELGPLRTYEPWDASAPRVLMGTLDDTHFPWVHEGILGDRSQPAPPNHKVWREGRYMRVEFTTQQPSNDILEEDNGHHSENGAVFTQEVDYSYHVGIPNVLRLITIHRSMTQDGDDRNYVIWLAVCPRKYNHTDTYWRLARNFDKDPAHSQNYESFEDHVRAQDRPMVESQRPWLLPPFWTKIELPLRPADLPLIEYQRWLEEVGITIQV